MITLYSTGCPKCNILKTKLNEKGVEYEICDDVDAMQEKGFTVVPMLEVDGKIMNFLESNKWIKEIR